MTFDVWLPGSHPLYLVRYFLLLHSGAGVPSCGGQTLDLPATSKNNLFRPSSVVLDYPVTMICVSSMDIYQKCQSTTSIVCGDGLSSHDDFVPYSWIIIEADYSMDYQTCVPSLMFQEGICDQGEVLTEWHLLDSGLCWCVEVVHILVDLK